jgi:hypothetical protein
MRYSATAFAVLLLQRPPVRLAACHEIDWDNHGLVSSLRRRHSDPYDYPSRASLMRHGAES